MSTNPLTAEEQLKDMKCALDAFHAACAPHLKEGEGIAERLERYHTETQGLLGELAQERLRCEALEKETGFVRLSYDQLVARHDQDVERAKAIPAHLAEGAAK